MKRNDENLITVSSPQTKVPAPADSKTAYDVCKRCFDVVCSFLGLVVLFVPLLIVALVIVIDSPGAYRSEWASTDADLNFTNSARWCPMQRRC